MAFRVNRQNAPALHKPTTLRCVSYVRSASRVPSALASHFTKQTEGVDTFTSNSVSAFADVAAEEWPNLPAKDFGR